MNIKKWVALVMTVAVLCTAFSGLTFVKAADYTLATDYESSVSYDATLYGYNIYRNENFLVCYKYGFDAADATTNTEFLAQQVNDGELNAVVSTSWWYNTSWYTAKNRTATNSFGTEVAVNEYGIVTAVVPDVGNMEIPVNGYVLSGNGTAKDFLDQVQVGDAVYIYTDGNPDTVHIVRTSEDSDYTHDTRACDVKRTGLLGLFDAGQTATSGTYHNDYLVKLTSGTAAGNDAKGYIVKHGGYGTTVPEGYMVISSKDQSLEDNEDSFEAVPKYGGAYAFERYGNIGAVVSINSANVFFRFDARAAVRNALLLTGISGTVDGQTIAADEFADSARAILEDAKTNYRLVEIAAMETLYNQMVACTNDMLALNVTADTTQEDIESYHVTIKSLYQQIYDLSFETRTVEMRATWWTPMERKSDAYKTYSADDWDTHLKTEITRIKKLGYNMIFVETLFNSTVIFPNSPAYEGVAYQQNPYLVPDEGGGLNTVLDEPYDMLQRIIDICKENDIEPHIQWMTCYVAYRRIQDDSDDLYEYSIVNKYLRQDTTKYANWLNQSLKTNDADENYSYQVPNTKTYQYFLNPQNTDARQFVLNTLQYVMENYDVESIQLDYCRYPAANSNNSGFGFDSDTLEAFKQSSYYNASTYTDDYINSTAMVADGNWARFRANYVTTWVKGVYDLRNTYRPDLYITASPDPDPDHAMEDVQQDVSVWLSNDYIDVLFPMAYGQNVPGHITPMVTGPYPSKFVCVGTDNDYFSEEYEMRWLRETRAAGADGIASFCESKLYANEEGDVWTTPAVTPTGNAAVAAITYITDTVNARIAKMLSLGDIDAAGQATLLEATKALSETIHIYGIASADFTALQTAANAIGGNPAAAIANDITYLEKIQKNSRDEAKEHAAVALDPGVTLKIGTATLDQDNAQATPAFAYSAATNVLIITTTTTLTGVAPAGLEIYIEGGDTAKTVHFNGVSGQDGSDIAVAALANTSLSNVTIRLSGTTVMSSVDVLGDAKHVYGVGVINDAEGTILRCQGDVNDDDKITTADVRTLLRYNVRSENLTTEQASRCDANGDGKINTTDTRLFLEKSLNLKLT